MTIRPPTLERPTEEGVPPPPEVLFKEARQRRRRRWVRVLAVLVVAAAGAGTGYGAIGRGGHARTSKSAAPASSSRALAKSTRSATGGSLCGSGPVAVTNCLLALSFVNSKVGFGVYAGPSGPAQVVSTTDGGSTWHDVGRAPVGYGAIPNEFPALTFVDASNGIEYGTGGVFATHNGGRSWAPIPVSGRVLAVTSAGRRLWLTDTTCPMSPSTTPCTVGIEASTDAGRTWKALALPPEPYRTAQTAVGPGGTLVVAGWADPKGAVSDDPGVLLVSTDGGGSWQTTPLPCPTGDRLGGQLSLAPSSRTIWMVCSTEGAPFGERGNVVYRSTDLGASWEAESSNALSGPTTAPRGAPIGTIDALVARSSTDAWVLEMTGGLLVHGGLLATSDGGRSWHDAMPSTIHLDTLHGTLDVVSPNDAYVAVHAFLSLPGGLWRTEDGGLTWRRL